MKTLSLILLPGDETTILTGSVFYLTILEVHKIINRLSVVLSYIPPVHSIISFFLIALNIIMRYIGHVYKAWNDIHDICVNSLFFTPNAGKNYLYYNAIPPSSGCLGV